MTAAEIIEILKEIPQDREISICGDKIENEEPIDEFSVSWMDCSDAVLIFIE